MVESVKTMSLPAIWDEVADSLEETESEIDKFKKELKHPDKYEENIEKGL